MKIFHAGKAQLYINGKPIGVLREIVYDMLQHEFVADAIMAYNTCKLCGMKQSVADMVFGRDMGECPGVWQIPKDILETRCECGAAKVYGAGKYEIGHSRWCPWSIDS